MTKRSLPNMKDVAERALVSLATVDRVLHGRPGVRGPTVKRVMDAAADLGYVFEASEELASQAQQLNIMFLLPDTENAFLHLFRDTVGFSQDSWTPFRVNCHVETFESLNPEALAKALLRHGRRYDGVAFHGLEHPLVREAVNILADEGVPLVTFVSDVSHSDCAAFVGMDNHAAGRTAAYLMTRFMGARAQQHGTKVMLVAGSLSYRAHVERQTGFLQLQQEKYPKIQVVGLREGAEEIDANYRHARALLEQHPDLSGIYCIGGGAKGITRALQEANLGHKVVFIGHGLGPDTRAALIDGAMDASIYQTPINLIGNCVRIFANLRDGHQATQGLEPVRVAVVLRENLP